MALSQNLSENILFLWNHLSMARNFITSKILNQYCIELHITATFTISLVHILVFPTQFELNFLVKFSLKSFKSGKCSNTRIPLNHRWVFYILQNSFFREHIIFSFSPFNCEENISKSKG